MKWNRPAALAILVWTAFASLARGQEIVPWHNDEVNSVWQWSLPAPTIPDRRALLWVPPCAERVRGIILAVQNMLEEPLFQRKAFREACAENGLGLLLIESGHDHIGSDDKSNPKPVRSSLDIFLNGHGPNAPEDPKGAGEDLQTLLNAFAEKSGYEELKYAPLMTVGHSSAGPFVWHLFNWDPSRFFGVMPFKTGLRDNAPTGIPMLDMESQWFDYGKNTRNVSSAPGSAPGQQKVRTRQPDALFGMYVEVGSGHCDVGNASIPIFRAWLKSVVNARIPKDAPKDGPVKLNTIETKSGWLIPVDGLGKAGVKPVAYAEYNGDPKNAFWYVDQTLADAIQTEMISMYGKKPQQINFVNDEGQVPTTGGTFNLSPKFLDDQVTFKVEAKYIDHVDNIALFPPGTILQNSGDPILYRVNSGAIRQVGPNLFRIVPHAGPIEPQGNPWEPTIVAYTLGNSTFQPTERPAHLNVDIVNRKGAAQAITFPRIQDRSATDRSPIQLTATASSGLPIMYFVLEGPVRVGDDQRSLVLDDVPSRAKYPIEVVVAAWQWGRKGDRAVQTASPVTQTFKLFAAK